MFTVRTVVIDAGHGGKDPGCHGAKYKEKDIALSVALKLGHYIEENIKDVKVVYTRKTDVFVELQERAEIANRAKADLFICIHCNSACVRDKKLKRDVCNEEAHGAETYIMGIKNEKGKLDVAKTENSAILLEDNYVKKYNGFDPNSDESYIIMSMFTDVYLTQSLSFASKIQKQYGTRIGRVDKGVKRASLWVLWRTYMPSVLTEMGFLTNPEEELFLGSTKGQDYMASGIFRAFREYKDEIEGIVKKYDDEVESQLPYKMSKEDSIQRDNVKNDKTTVSSKTEPAVPIKPKETKAPAHSDSAETKKKPDGVKPDGGKHTETASTQKGGSGVDSKSKEQKSTAADKAAYDKMKSKALEANADKEKKAEEGKEEDTIEKEVKPVDTETAAPLIYKVQILSSDKKIPFNSPKLKGAEKPGVYLDKGVYKYTSGEFQTPEEAYKLQAELKKIGFKDAFVITTRNGKRITQK